MAPEGLEWAATGNVCNVRLQHMHTVGDATRPDCPRKASAERLLGFCLSLCDVNATARRTLLSEIPEYESPTRRSK